MYHGPAGHAPEGICFDCWASEWGEMERAIYRGANWQPLDAALFLLCQGFNHREAADMIGIHRRTLYNWMRVLRQHPELLPEWLDTQRKAKGRGVR